MENVGNDALQINKRNCFETLFKSNMLGVS